jgi:regulator of protease activity HflC (stomatin/prohibitin superfamily)
MLSVARRSVGIVSSQAARSFWLRVRTGEVAALETLGKFSKVLPPGFHLRVPVLQQFTSKRSTQVDDAPFGERCKTKVGAFADVTGLVTGKLVDLELYE